MTTILRRVLMPVVLALFVSSAALSALADADPPGRAVRIKYISGAVSLQPGGVNDWVAAVVNRPLTTSDRVWTDKEARAELHLGSAALRMNAETSLTFTNVSDDIVQVELDQGTLNLHIRHLFGGETYEIDTPNQAFTILKPGDYRFDVDPNADITSVTVWKGEGEANGQGPGVKLRSGHQATFSGGTSLEHQTASAPDLDGFDDWCRVRDDREDHAKSYQYVSADVVGADDLDEYGTWRVESAYGPVWVPAVAPGWAPYHNGHWVWVDPWGWTWVDEAPWGFAPSHYGRWVHVGGYWAWAPGPFVVARPVYAPALVAWVGGPHFGVSLTFGGGGGVGWFPLGWGEPYVPSYHASRSYFQQVNVTNTHITNITTVTNNYYVTNNNTTVVNNNVHNIRYVNQNVTGAVTAVPTRTMTNSEPVARAAVAVNASELRTAAVVNTAAVAPVRTSVLGTRAGAQTALPPSRVMAARPVVSRAAPPARPVPFEVREGALARTPGRPLDAQTESLLRSNMARPTAPTAQAPTQPMQPVRPGSPMATNPNAIQPRPVPRPGGPQRFPGEANGTGTKPETTTAQPATQPMQPMRPGSPMATSPSGTQPRPVPRPGGPQRFPSETNDAGTKPETTTAQPATQSMQPMRPGSPMATSPSGTQPRPVPRPGGPQRFPSETNDAGTKPETTTAQPATQPMQPVRPGSPMATSPSGTQPRPVPRPGGPQKSSGVIENEGSGPVMTTTQPAQPPSHGRVAPRPSQPDVPTSPAAQGQNPDVVRPVARPMPASRPSADATRAFEPAPAPPGASTGVVRRSVETATPSAPRVPQAVSMPRSEPAAPQAASHAHTVVQAPHENSRHENKAQPSSKHEEKSDRQKNR